MTEEVPKVKKPIYKRWWVWVLGVVVLFIIIGASGGKSTPKQSVPAADDKTASTASQQSQQAPPVPQTLLDLSGSGTKTTQKFTAAGDWDLAWSYDCSNFGYQGNFIVSVYNGDGTMSFTNSGINQLGKSGSDVDHYHQGGTFYLQVNSECKWKINIKG